MSRLAGDWVEIYTPAELDVAGVNTAGPVTKNGTYVDISRYDTFLVVLVCSGGTTALPTVHLRFAATTATGVETPWIPLRGGTSPPWVAGPVAVVQVSGDRSTWWAGNEATIAPSLANSFAALDRIKFQLQVVSGVAGTADLHLFAKVTEVK